MTIRPRRRSILTAVLATALATGLTIGGSAADAHSTPAVPPAEAALSPAAAAKALAPSTRTASEAALYAAMRELWAQHMEWTYATIAAFASDSKGLTATLNRLLRNQTDIGNAIKLYYGDAAGNQLTQLLQTHIKDYLPVLKAAKAGHQAAANKAFAKVLANGVEIGKFLEHANPSNWSAPRMQNMLSTHNRQTLTYAAEQLQGKYAASVTDYGKAEAHMLDMADLLAKGIIAQFPDRFSR